MCDVRFFCLSIRILVSCWKASFYQVNAQVNIAEERYYTAPDYVHVLQTGSEAQTITAAMSAVDQVKVALELYELRPPLMEYDRDGEYRNKKPGCFSPFRDFQAWFSRSSGKISSCSKFYRQKFLVFCKQRWKRGQSARQILVERLPAVHTCQKIQPKDWSGW
jgi:hypothetical protein